MINVLRNAINESGRKDAGLFREMRTYEERRLALEDRVARDSAQLFFPQGMSKAEIISHCQNLLERAESLPE